MPTCPTCGTDSPDGVRFCPKDGTALSPIINSPGSLIGSMVDRYRIVGRLGEGGMGTVFRAEHTHLNRQVALKLLHPELARSTAVLDRFFREARAASEVKSPHIIEVTDFGTTSEGLSFLVMELLDGVSLRELLDKQRDRRLPPPRAVAIAVQIADALAASHAAGVVHRDLKPANVLLVSREDNPDFVKILDFGIAKLEDQGGAQLTHAGMIMGSPTYMAPEQAAGKTVDGRADLYSLGVILYEMLAGSPPFAGDGPTSVLMAQLNEQPEPLRSRNPEVPAALEALVMRCLAKRADERPQDPPAVKAALQAWLDGQPDELLRLSSATPAGSVTMPERPAALATARSGFPPESQGAVRDPATTGPAEFGRPVSASNGPAPSQPAPPRRRTGLAVAAAVTGALGGIALTLHLLGVSPAALIDPLARRLTGTSGGSGAGPVPGRRLVPPQGTSTPSPGPPDAAATLRASPPADAAVPDAPAPPGGAPLSDGGSGRTGDTGASTVDDDNDDLRLDEDEEDEGEAGEQAQPPSDLPAKAGTAPDTPPGKVSKATKRAAPAKKKVHKRRLTPRQRAQRKALKAKIMAAYARLKARLRGGKISQAQYRRAVAQLKARYRRLRR